MRQLRRNTVIGLLLLNLLPVRASAFAGTDMLDMMRIMSAMMGLYNTFSGVSGMGGYNALNPMLGNQWGLLGNQAGGIPGIGTSMNPWASALDMPAPPNDLSMDGEWISEDGGALTFRGDRFLLNNGRGQMMEGSFMIYRNRLIAYVYPSEDVLVFSFERRGERFVVQDEQGRMMMFQRVQPWQSDW